MSWGGGGEGETRPRDQCPLCVPTSLHGPANIYFSNTFFSISMWIVFLPFQALHPFLQHPLSSVALRWCLRWSFQPFWWVTQFACVSPMCTCSQTLLDFYPLNCLMSLSFIVPAGEPVRVEEKFSSFQTFPYHTVTESGVWLLITEKSMKRQDWCKGKFSLLWILATGGGGEGKEDFYSKAICLPPRQGLL